MGRGPVGPPSHVRGVRVSAKTRNDRRKLVIGIIDPLARLILAAGLVKPFFAPGPDDLLAGVLGVIVSVALWTAVAYLIRSIEDEE